MEPTPCVHVAARTVVGRQEGNAMDRTGVARRLARQIDSADDVVLPSRAEAIARLKRAIIAGDGPVLLTGEPGVGKSWVAVRVVENAPFGWRWASVALTPAIGAIELDRLILHAIGIPVEPGIAANRKALQDALRESAEESVRWGLLVEEAHNGSDPVLEELRVLGTRIGRLGAFGAILLIGQTALIRRLETRPLAALDARILTRVAIGRLDVDELHTFLTSIDPARVWEPAEVERFYRASEGNPRRALRFARCLAETPRPRAGVAQSAPAVLRASGEPGWTNLPIVPAKPPIEVGEEMIEVGWEPSAESDIEAESDGASPASPGGFGSANIVKRDTAGSWEDAESASGEVTVEPINDRYAALQAWTEWAHNQGRDPINSAERPVDSEAEELETRATAPTPSPGGANVWAEGQHSFAPYSQLFTRLRQNRDAP
jgi:type II secretory pathway predicted ATPase ExeA